MIAEVIKFPELPLLRRGSGKVRGNPESAIVKIERYAADEAIRNGRKRK